MDTVSKEKASVKGDESVVLSLVSGNIIRKLSDVEL
jgi:hypothetical protein